MAWEQKPNPIGYPKDWQAIRSRVLLRAKHKCVKPDPDFKGCTNGASEVDHIDGDIENNDYSNLRALCSACHKEVTKQNWRDSRNLKNPRTEPIHPADLIQGVKDATELIDDLPSDNEEEWITTFGPVYEKLENGNYKRPEKTLGKHIINWMLKNLQINGKPFKPNREQARIIMWMYALDSVTGRWLFDRTLHIAPKGSGKDPFGASLCCVELAGPARFSHWDDKGEPVPKRVENAWIQIAAVSLSQNQNTLQYLKGMFNKDAVVRYQIEEQAETIYAFGRKSKIQTVSSASNSLEGNTPSFAMLSETQHWLESNGCHALFNVIQRNLRKVSGSHFYMATNAYNPNQNSIAQIQFETWQDSQMGKIKPSKLLVVMKGATHKAPYLTMDQRMKVLEKVYGSASLTKPGGYTDILPIAEGFDDKTTPTSDQLRFYYNTIGIPSEAWVDIRLFDKCVHPRFDPEAGIPRASKLLLFFDGSKNSDATVLVGMVTEGHLAGMITTFGVWEKPHHLKGDVADSWQVPREEVDATVEEIFRNYRVQGFWADPSHKMDSEGGGSYWGPLINEWHRRYSRKLAPSMWAKGTEHSINWDMTSHANQKTFTDALKSVEQEISDNTLRHDGNTDMRRHVMNARRFKSKRFGETISKESNRSLKKIDLAVGMVGVAAMYYKLTTNKRTMKTNQQQGYKVPERSN
jgi:hypothetical protein